ncbi:MAG: hypothetical protein FJ161_02615 [Gammaproteobacteria bacterium]|nr:hypothetical protein [Gammaproteobacteria bacterium]
MPSTQSAQSEQIRLQRNLELYDRFSFLNFFIYQVAVTSICAIVTVMYPSNILNLLSKINVYVGLTSIYGINYYATRDINKLIKEKTLAECLLLQSSLIYQGNYMQEAATSKLNQLRSTLSYQDYLKKIAETLDEIKKSDSQHRVVALTDFYNMIRLEHQPSWTDRFRFNITHMFSDEELPILSDQFYADACIIALSHGADELAFKIYRDYSSFHFGSKISNSLKEILKEKIHQEKIHVNIEFPELQKHTPSTPKWLLRMISMGRYLGGDLVVASAYVQDYILRQYILGQQLLAVIGLSLASIAIVFFGFASLCLAVLGIRVLSRMILRQGLKSQSLSALLKDYHYTQDDKLLSLIGLKIQTLLKTNKLEDFQSLTAETAGVYEKRNAFFLVMEYIQTHRQDFSSEKIASIHENLLIFAKTFHPDGQALLQKYYPHLQDDKQKEAINTYQSLMWFLSSEKVLKDLIFPINTVASASATSIILLIPALTLTASMVYTVVPAVCFIVILALWALASWYVRSRITQNFDKITLSELLDQKFDRRFEEVFFQKILTLEAQYIQAHNQKNHKKCNEILEEFHAIQDLKDHEYPTGLEKYKQWALMSKERFESYDPQATTEPLLHHLSTLLFSQSSDENSSEKKIINKNQ